MAWLQFTLVSGLELGLVPGCAFPPAALADPGDSDPGDSDPGNPDPGIPDPGNTGLYS